MSTSALRSTEAKAGVLALGVHAVFLILLIFGVSWQTHHPEPVMVDLWQTLPETPPAPRIKSHVAPKPVTKPEPVAKPTPVVKEVAPPKAPDIALEKKKEIQRQAKIKQAELEEQKTLERLQAKKAQELADKLKQHHQTQLKEEQELQRKMMDAELANESRQIKQLATRAVAARRNSEMSSVVAKYQDEIRAKVRSNTRLPENLKGNPQVKFQVHLLPTGEVLNVKLVQSSGNPALDDAVERAINKSSPLPLPTEKEARAAFVPAVILSHLPKDQ